MCGIFGWVSKSRIETHPLVDVGLDVIKHRGPDGDGFEEFHTSTDGQVVLAHRRLSIIDIDGGSQPMWSHDRRYVISFNGEIYNYIELRDELRSGGSRFTSNSDTEVVIEAYRRWGQDALLKLRGMFAFALYDRNKETLLLARDPFGKKPLFLAETARGFTFASDIRSLIDLPGFGKSLDEAVLGEYLQTRFVSGQNTMFRGVRKLLPGHYAVWQNGSLEKKRYYEPPFATVTPNPAITEEEATVALRSALDEAVRIRMRSDAPFGAYLSGGLDSSIIVALMSRHAAAPVSTFSVGFEEAEYSEAHHARMVASSLGTRHEEIFVSASDFEANWQKAAAHRGAPVSEASDIPILLLSEFAGSRVKMVLTGEGADELLGGYAKYIAERHVVRYQRFIPPAIHRKWIHPLVSLLPHNFERMKILSRAMGEDRAARQVTWFSSLQSSDVKHLLGGRQVSWPAERLSSRTGALPERELQLNDQRYWLPDNLLERGDRMMMAGSVEGRMPFMDTELSKLVATFPQHLLTGSRQGKKVLRSAASGLVDPSIINRKKVGFTVPLGRWFRSELRDMIFDLVGTGAVIRTILEPRRIDCLLEEHMSGSQDHQKALWTLANLEIFIKAHRVE